MDKRVKMLIFLNQLSGIGIVKQNKVFIPFLAENPDEESLTDFVFANMSKIMPVEIKFAWDYANRAEERLLADSSVHTITVFDELYPKQFLDLGDKKPVLLFAKGNVDALARESLGVIGTRNPSERSVGAEKVMVTQAIEWTGRSIVSGLALGCDYIAHRTALDVNGCTIAILPCGFKHISPPSHTSLANEIANSSGCLLSEYEPTFSADKYMFVRRDTLVAAFSQKLLVVECGLKSGTMYAVNESAKLGRPIGCLSLDDLQFDGNENIITEKGGQRIVGYTDWGQFLG